LFRRIWAHSFSSLGGVVSISSPLDVTGCLLWLRADLGVTKVDNKVSSWKDSALGSDASQSSDDLKPLYVENQINDLPVIRFGGTDDYMSGVLVYNAKPLHMFQIYKRITLVAGADGLTIVNTSDGDTNQSGAVLNFNSSTTQIDTYHAGYKSQLTSPGLANGVVALVESKFDGVNNTLYVNGVAKTPVADTGTFNSTNYYIGCRYFGGTVKAGYLNADIAEILIYDSALSDPDRLTVETYLNGKYKVY